MRTFGAKRGRAGRLFTRDERSRGGFAAAKVKRHRAMQALAGLTPVEIFRRGYAQGWKQGVRRERRRLGLVAA